MTSNSTLVFYNSVSILFKDAIILSQLVTLQLTIPHFK